MIAKGAKKEAELLVITSGNVEAPYNYHAGYYWSKDQAVHWDGRNSFGEKVSSGIYFYQFKAGKTVKSGKMTILK